MENQSPLSTESQNDNKKLHDLHDPKCALIYPALYFALNITLSVARFAEIIGHPFPSTVIYVEAAIYHLDGVSNVLLYTTTRREFIWSWLGWTKFIMNVFTSIHPHGEKVYRQVSQLVENDPEVYIDDSQPRKRKNLLGYLDQGEGPCTIKIPGQNDKSGFCLGTIGGSKTALIIDEDGILFAYSDKDIIWVWKKMNSGGAQIQIVGDHQVELIGIPEMKVIYSSFGSRSSSPIEGSSSQQNDRASRNEVY